eukprot:TRINITY_DN5050_c0_g2_i1.p1 TRINITY_DN5050_c0_g2~~TRINITY_DN5050_c0_g2_i1.p1  ORF type:complete len:103 (-),score=17.27 TRINITY_DN5050_c0_g2_i1:135-443(-)
MDLDIELSLFVDNIDVGAIIGRKGQNISMIRNTYRVFILVKADQKGNNNNNENGPQDKIEILIRGYCECVFGASRMVHSFASAGVSHASLEFVLNKWKIDTV